ncbi:transport and Golgi organization protein 1 homolog isoform X2 [Camelus dromedarius]|uniref:transport and Golgi organization protein 1 homolog isoform X2 n=1 Tax=Camelus dromedarius TaxID=9838 RepID=UPI003119C906
MAGCDGDLDCVAARLAHVLQILHTLILLFHPGSDVYELLWKLILIAASWEVSSFLLFVWNTVFAVKPPVSRVTLKQVTEQIKNLENKNRELAENISAWVQKTNNAKKCLEETIRQKKMRSEKALKFKNLKTIERASEYLNDVIQIAQAKLQAVRDQNAKSPHLPGVSKTRSEGSMQRAVTTGDCSLEEVKKKMQDHHAASGSLKEGEEDNFQRQVKKVHVCDEIGGQRTMDTEGKVNMNGCELVGKQQLLVAEEEAKLAEEKTQQYKIRLEECHGQMREAEIIWRHQVALAEKAQDSSLRAQ